MVIEQVAISDISVKNDYKTILVSWHKNAIVKGGPEVSVHFNQVSAFRFRLKKTVPRLVASGRIMWV